MSLISTNPEDKPIFDNDHYSTEADRYRLRTAVRMTVKMMNSSAGKEISTGEVVPEGYKEPLSEAATDEEIDARISKDAR